MKRISFSRSRISDRFVVTCGIVALAAFALAYAIGPEVVHSGIDTDGASLCRDGSRIAYRDVTNNRILVKDYANGWTRVMSTGVSKVGYPRISRDCRFVTFNGNTTGNPGMSPYAVRITSANPPTPIRISSIEAGDVHPPAVSNHLGDNAARYVWKEHQTLPVGMEGGPTAYEWRSATVGDSFVVDSEKIPIGYQGGAGAKRVAITSDGLTAFIPYLDTAYNATQQIRTAVFSGSVWSITSEIVSTAATGGTTDGLADWPTSNYSGTRVAFTSTGQLASGDGGGNADVFVRHRGTTSNTYRAYLGNLMYSPDGDATYPDINNDGTSLVFQSGSTTLVFKPNTTEPLYKKFCSLTTPLYNYIPQATFLVKDWWAASATIAALSVPAIQPAPPEGPCLLQGIYPTISNPDASNELAKAFHSDSYGIASGDNESPQLVNVIRKVD